MASLLLIPRSPPKAVSSRLTGFVLRYVHPVVSDVTITAVIFTHRPVVRQVFS